ncbi:MAG: hypothetical protein LUC44_06255 [Prevotellaceae bacterium]|nr:hypothetical protein [Prevotellaceae bacterium]
MMKRLSMFVATACLGLALPMYAQDAVGAASVSLANGDYVLQNVESGLYLAGGNAYGTEATLLSTPVVFTLTAKDDGTYTLTSELYGTTDGKANGIFYDGGNFYLDHPSPYPLTITAGTGNNEGTYTITCPYYETNDDATTYNTDYYLYSDNASNGDVVAHSDEIGDGTGRFWKFIAVAGIPAIQAAAEVGTDVDVTPLLKNPSFSVKAEPSTSESTNNWTYTWHNTPEGESTYEGNYSYGYTPNANDWSEGWYGMLERWEPEGGFDFYQTLTGLTPGHYTLSTQAFQGDEDDYTDRCYLYATVNSDDPTKTILPDDEGNAVTSTDAAAITYAAFLAGNYSVSVQFDITSTDDVVRIGVSDFFEGESDAVSASWCVVAGLFNLTYVRDRYSYIDDDEYTEGDEVEIDGATVTINGENLVQNGGFNEGVADWTCGDSGDKYTTAADVDNFTITSTGGHNDGAYITTNGAGTSSEKTLTQHIGVTKGSSYLFVCYTSGTTPKSDNLAYNALFTMSDATTEVCYIKEFNWGAAAEQTATGWTRTAFTFTATTSDVGIRLGWNESTNFDAFQLYEIELPDAVDDADYVADDQIISDGKIYTVKDGTNLVQNGSFNNGVTDWTSGNGYTNDPTATYITQTPVGGYNGGAYITPITETASDKTGGISQAISVTQGTTYLFIGYTNGTAPSENNKDANSLHAMSDKSTESSVIVDLAWENGYGQTSTTWKKTETVFTATTDYVGIRASWCPGASFDGFQLYELTEQVYTLQDVKDAVAAINAPTVNVGTEPFQYNEDLVADLVAKAAAADEMSDELTSYEYYEAIVGLQAAQEAVKTLNEPQEGDLFHIIMKSEGHTYYDKALYFHRNDESHSEQGHYDMAFESEPSANLADQVFIFTPVEDVLNGYTISFNANPEEIDADQTTYTDDNTTLRYFCYASEYGQSVGTAGFRTTIDPTKACTFVVEQTTTDGIVRLYNSDQNHYVGTNGTTASGFYTDPNNENVDLTINFAPDIKWTLEAEYGTLILPFAPTEEETEGLTFYSTEAYGTEPELALVEVESPEANTPYIVKGTEGTEYSFVVTARTFDTEATAGWLTGVYVPTSVPAASYVLQDGEDGLAFYTVTDDDPISLGANHCYLTVSSTSDETADEGNAEETNAPAVVYFPGSGKATAITGVEANVADAEAIYDLSGRKVSQAQKGIYIKGGKKVVIK